MPTSFLGGPASPRAKNLGTNRGQFRVLLCRSGARDRTCTELVLRIFHFRQSVFTLVLAHTKSKYEQAPRKKQFGTSDCKCPRGDPLASVDRLSIFFARRPCRWQWHQASKPIPSTELVIIEF